MLQVQDRPVSTGGQDDPRVPDPRRTDAEQPTRRDHRPQRPPSDALTWRHLGILVTFSLAWSAYLLLHVAGAIHLFGRP